MSFERAAAFEIKDATLWSAAELPKIKMLFTSEGEGWAA
jgi:hypothetical protein